MTKAKDPGLNVPLSDHESSGKEGGTDLMSAQFKPSDRIKAEIVNELNRLTPTEVRMFCLEEAIKFAHEGDTAVFVVDTANKFLNFINPTE